MAPFYDAIGGLMNRRQLAELLDPEPGMRILDAGGGTGLNRGLFPEWNKGTWIVLDVNENMLVRGKQKQRNCSFLRGSVLQIPVPTGSMDRVLIADALHHMPEPEAVLLESARVLSSQGSMIIEEINPDTPIGGGVELGEWMIGMGSHFFAPGELRSLLESADFVVEEMRRNQYLYTIVALPK